jgi:DNA-directed RNA polymerase subunit K/omega
MANTLNTGSLETLTPGNSLLVQAIEVANGKIQLEIAERLEGGSQSNNVRSSE